MAPPTPQALQALQPFDMNSIPQLVAAVGALGLASMGIVDALGKVFVFDSLSKKMRLKVFGLPYAGYGPVKRLVQKVAPALEVSSRQSMLARSDMPQKASPNAIMRMASKPNRCMVSSI